MYICISPTCLAIICFSMCTTLLYQPFCAPLFVNNSLISIIHASLLPSLSACPFCFTFRCYPHPLHTCSRPPPLFSSLSPLRIGTRKVCFCCSYAYSHSHFHPLSRALSLSHALSHSLSTQWNVYKMNHHRAKENSNYRGFFREITFVNIYIFMFSLRFS